MWYGEGGRAGSWVSWGLCVTGGGWGRGRQGGAGDGVRLEGQVEE